jgi:dinuclear metal center YbgI/SA1388 family protein
VFISDLVLAMERIAPVALAESWDNVGLLVGDPKAPLRSVLLTVDLLPEVIEEAAQAGANAVVAYHPPIFRPQKTFLAGDLAYHAARAGISVYSPHTALDVASGGTNDCLMDVLGIAERTPLRRRIPDGPGIGRVGDLPQGQSHEAFVALLKRVLQLPHVLVAGTPKAAVRRVAVCAGAGGSLVADAHRSGADVFVAGELGHHDALLAARLGLCVVCTLHSHTERLALPPLRARLVAELPGVDVSVSGRDADPFMIA